MTYLKKQNALAVINNDEEQLLSVMSARMRSKELKQLKNEMSNLRKEIDQLKIMVLEIRNGWISNTDH